ncbi:MAG: hypothetical protein ACI902_002025 [Psychroserpens sp.]|jgi:hypothetical protein
MNKNTSNKALILFGIVVFPVLAILNYFFLYNSDFKTSLTQAGITSVLVLIVFVVKIKLDRKQDNKFKSKQL